MIVMLWANSHRIHPSWLIEVINRTDEGFGFNVSKFGTAALVVNPAKGDRKAIDIVNRQKNAHEKAARRRLLQRLALQLRAAGQRP